MFDLQSPLAVVAIVAAIRRYAPRVDGPLVLLVAVLVGVALSTARALEGGVPLYFAVVDGALSGLAALGAMTAVDRARALPEVPRAPR